MHSILQENEFLKCPNCANLIASFSPVCEKCGFMTGEQGVVELARIEKENADAEDEARGLLEFISVSFVLLAIGYLLTFFGPEFSITVIFASIICAGLFWGKLAGWHRKYSSIEFPDERFDRSQTNKE